MLLKRQLRHILKDYLKLDPATSHQHRITHPRYLLESMRSKPDGKDSSLNLGYYFRALTSDKISTDSIYCTLDKLKEELGIVSIRRSAGIDDIYPESVIIECKLDEGLKSAWKSFGNGQILYNNVRECICDDLKVKPNKRVVIDFSSPNIAKPFHFGHLKSTILGNYLANLNKLLCNDVTKINYLGDWGTQYGLVSIGFERFGSEIELKKNPLRHLLDVYVRANLLAKDDEDFYRLARERFVLMDKSDDQNQLEQWNRFRDLSLSDLKLSYESLGIGFDVYDFESNYSVQARELISQLDEQNLLKTESNGARLINIKSKEREFLTPVLKSDGTSLYLTRDIAAAIDRKRRFDFDEMLYVVGLEQEHHMDCLFDSLRQLNYDWYDKLAHVGFGKVLGMSTRTGEFVLLEDILKEITKRYVESTSNTTTSKLIHFEEIQEASRQLALSALFVYDMRNSRKKSYPFDWNAVMVASPKSGLAIQASYARLHSLISTFPDIYPQVVQNNSIKCSESANLLECLSRFDDILFHSNEIRDPSPLIHYAFELSNCSNRALQSKHLRVRGQLSDVASTRLALFLCTHNVLKTIIELIGLRPLKRI